MKKLIDKIFKLNSEYCELRNFYDRQELGPPATKEEIQEIENYFSVSLPKDYRDFLLIYNGWRRFEGQLDLFSTKQMLDKRILENVAYIRNLAVGLDYSSLALGFVIQGCSTSADIVFLDFAGSKIDHTPDFVRWEFEEIRRFPNFIAYLEDCVQIREKMINLERERLR